MSKKNMYIGRHVDNYTIVEEYAHVVIGDNGYRKKCFSKAYADLTQAQRDKQEAYWRKVEAEFSRGKVDIAYGF